MLFRSSCSGTVPGEERNYYLKVISKTECEVYSDSLLRVPVSQADIPFLGVVSATVTATTAVTNVITVSSLTGFNLYDEVVFNGNVSTSGLEVGRSYYIYSLSPLKVSSFPNVFGTITSLTTTSGLSVQMVKAGDYGLLPPPVYFNQSIVRNQNNVYACIISNNDSEFVLGKWELLQSSDSRLNALDRINGYYSPTVNMPGLDISQLVTGVTYPNATYFGNAFAPDQQFTLDTIVPTVDFTTSIDSVSTYDIQGETFTSGYGPEELVPGVVTDS